ncbi:MAG: alpha/beta hydrolase [Patescibacteria group bacterium]
MIRYLVTNNQISNKQIIINNLLLNYYSVLPDKKFTNKTLVFLHGWGVDNQLWFKIVPELINKNYSLYFLDLPGFGQSQIPNTTYDVDDYKKIVYEFVEKLGLKKINLIGHSFGGRIAIKIGAENPDFLEKIILVDAAGIIHDSRKKKLLATISKFIKPIFKLTFMQPLRKKFYLLIGSEYLENIKLSKIFTKVVMEDLTHLFSKIKKQVLIIWGRDDKVTLLNDGKLMNKLIPNSKLVVFEKAGHFSFLDQPEEFSNELIKFIND